MWLVDLHYNFQCDWLIELSYNKLFQTNHNWGNCDFYDYVKKKKNPCDQGPYHYSELLI